MHVPIVLVVIVGMALLVSSQGPPDDCERLCGNVSIPFPFGLEERCSYNSGFLLACDPSIDHPQLITLGNSIDVTDINTTTSEIEVTGKVARECIPNNVTNFVPDNQITEEDYGSFSISNKNRFFAIGCDTLAVILGERGNSRIGGACLSTCDSPSDITDGSCSGVGCCETEIPKEMSFSNISLSRFTDNSDTSIWTVNDVPYPCNYAFVVEEGKYNFSKTDLVEFGGKELMMPRLLDWAIGNNTCNMVDKESNAFLCKGAHQECIQEYAGPGYRCRCMEGYDGNPYIKDNCTNIDECKAKTHNCKDDQCIDKEGNYTCPCPNGQRGEYRKDNDTCTELATTNKLPIIEISIGTSVAGLFLLILCTCIYLGLKRRKHLILREKFFKQNGGIMLQQRISGDGGSQIQAKLFTVEELEKATNNYDQSRVIGKGGFGTVFKGVLPDDKIVAIKKSKIVDQTQTQVDQFINEVVILSQVNHRNVVKLIGCCLETEVPLLVYEFIPNGTLFDHIHNECKSKTITWDIRLRIATETAGALSYLHFGASIPIIHRDVKPMNILIDSSYVAKVADFGASRLIPMDQNELATMVQGTLGYLDPEYFHTGQLTEKSDVYSFGVVLVELLTGKKIVDFSKPEKERNLTKSFIASLEKENLLQILDENFQLKEVPHDIIQVSRLAQRCVHVKGDERPTMKEVTLELEGISTSMIDMHPWVKSTSNEEEPEYLLNVASEDREDTDNTDTSPSAFYSIICIPKIMSIGDDGNYK